jgi:hypothetical protein
VPAPPTAPSILRHEAIDLASGSAAVASDAHAHHLAQTLTDLSSTVCHLQGLRDDTHADAVLRARLGVVADELESLIGVLLHAGTDG